ncbi:MAG: glycosyltransferase family 2 protein [Candidatus Eisenbacteria bacterium]|uniref:Glycosyltransferase family 2 protein n=1 Tax=Eiseniibacteriota bacterium TaxID=2212470 RepID=A0A538THS0_UNCEI|nr:MAG: glycosyltransferase family 2 protein [Candidatus Eisenbacteria bacterium]
MHGWTVPPWGMDVINTTSLVILIYFSALQLVLFGLLILSFFDMRRRLAQNFYADYEAVAKSHFTFPITVLVPAYNEAAGVIDSVRSVLSLDYPQHEVIVINDGSTDDTMERLRQEFRLERRDLVFRKSLEIKGAIRGLYRSATTPHLTVIDKEHAGKSDALNAGLNLSRYPLFCTIDADSLFQENALLRVVRPFLEDPDRVIAVGGQVRVANGCRVERGRVVEPRLPTNILAAFQVVEYLRAFVASRLGLSAMNNLLILSGVFSLFRKDVVIEVGGYRGGVVTEDMELVLRLHRRMREQRRPYAVVFLPDPICWTEVPETLGALARQRNRWYRGLIHSLWLHKSLLWGKHSGSLRWIGLPYYFFFEFMGPIVELVGYVLIPICYFLGILSPVFFWAFLFLSVTSGAFLSISSVFLEELSFGLYRSWGDFAQMVGIGVLENFSYRILTLFFRLGALVDIILGRGGWGKQERAGFGRAKPVPAQL